MKDSFEKIFAAAKSILIILPSSPFFDQVAAGLSLFLSFKQGKNVAVTCSTPMLVEFNRLVGVNKVVTDPGNKNLVVRLTDYNPENIEQVLWDVDEQGMFVTVVPKTEFDPPNKDQVVLSYSGISADTAILVGGVSEKHFPILADKGLKEVNLVHVGTSDITLSRGKQVLSFARSASSVSEIVALLLKESNFSLNADSATNLLAGIYEGSDSFTKGVTAETFKIASELMNLGAQIMPKIDEKKEALKPGFQPHLPTTTYPSQVGVQTQNLSSLPPKSWLEPKIFRGTKLS